MSVPHEMKNELAVESLFNTLKAENEPWLGAVFVSLPVFERLRGDHSTILYGETGSGKTALRLELKRQQGARTFSALWTPEPVGENLELGTALAHQAMRQALRACVETLILEGDLMRRLSGTSDYILSALKWFLQTYLPFDAAFYVQSQAGQLAKEEINWYVNLLQTTTPSIVNEQTTLNDQVRLFVNILRHANYEQLLLTIDGLERWMPRQAGRQVATLVEAILSTLVIFDVPGTAFKFFVPVSLRASLHGTTGVERYRADEIQLSWSIESLQAMLSKRLAYSLAPRKISLDSICEGNEFINWLHEFASNSPREWLRLSLPMIKAYHKHGKRLSVMQTHEVLRQYPPSLSLDRGRKEVWIGKKCISIGSPSEFRLLEYLSNHSGKICSLEELYYYAQEKLDTVPDKGDKRWVHKDNWRPAMDTMIWRVRQKIERDPKKPIYLITHHGKGLELTHVDM